MASFNVVLFPSSCGTNRVGDLMFHLCLISDIEYSDDRIGYSPRKEGQEIDEEAIVMFDAVLLCVVCKC